MSASNMIRALVLMVFLGMAGGPPPSFAEAGDDFLARYAETYRFRLGRPGSARVTPDGTTILFLRSPSRSFVQDLYAHDVASGEERLLLSADSILRGGIETLSVEEKARRERMRETASGIVSFQLSPDGRQVLVPLAGTLWLVERESGAVREVGAGDDPPIDPRFSPDGARIACVRGGNLHVIDVADGSERALTTGGGGSLTYGLAEFVAQEEMDRREGYWWSPDSRWIVLQETDTSGLERMHILDPTHPEKAPAVFPYPRPGKANAVVRLGIVSVEGGEPIWFDWDRDAFEYLATVAWAEGGPLTVLLQNRTQTAETLFAVDPETGVLTALLEETDPAWLNLFPGTPAWLPDGAGFLWISEREGYPRLEHRAPDGSLLRPLHDASLGLKGFERLLDGGRALVRAAADPTEARLFVLSWRNGETAPTALTPERGTHATISKGAGPLLAVRSELENGRVLHRIADAEGMLAGEIRSVAEDPGFEPRIEYLTVGEDPRFHAAVIRPADFRAGRRYPVIFHVYGGPHYQEVEVRPSAFLLDHWMADQGYVVVKTDARGTPGRGRDWERAIKGDVISIPLDDHVRVLRALGERFPELDLERVGIYGWSFGGYFAAMAMTREPGVFRAGVAGSPVADWADYDTHYTERYLGLPAENEAGYRESNVLTHVDGLEGSLLLVHGTDDDNVYFMHSLKLADALFRAGKRFEFLPLAGFTHMVPDPRVTERLYGGILDFFDRSLKDAESARP